MRFYAAEIALALFHLHDMGLMYRQELSNKSIVELAALGVAATATSAARWHDDRFEIGGSYHRLLFEAP